MGLYDILNAAAQGVSGFAQARDSMQQRQRQQQIEDEEREADKRRQGLERALLELQIGERQNPQPEFDVGPSGTTVRGVRDPLQAQKYGKVFTQPESEDVNWQMVQTPDGYVQVNPRTGEKRDLGIQSAPESWQVVGTAGGYVQVNPRTGETRPVMSGGAQVTQPQPGGGAGGEQGRMAAAMLPLAEDAYARMAELATPTFRQTLAQKGTGFLGIGNYFNTPEGRQFQQTANQFLSAALSIVSGRTVSEQEVARTAQVYIPQPGDDPGTIERKMGAMELMAKSIRRLAGQPEAPAVEAPDTRGPLRSGYVAPHPDNPYR